MTGLRTIWGVSLEKIETDFGADYKAQILAYAEKFIDQGLLVISNDREKSHNRVLKTTQKGKFLVDGIASDLFMI